MAKKTEKELEIQRLDKKTPLQMIWDYVMITVASFVYAVSVSLFLDPNSLAPGGITGIAIILNRKIDTPVQAYDEYLSMYKTILNEMEKNDFKE